MKKISNQHYFDDSKVDSLISDLNGSPLAASFGEDVITASIESFDPTAVDNEKLSATYEQFQEQFLQAYDLEENEETIRSAKAAFAAIAATDKEETLRAYCQKMANPDVGGADNVALTMSTPSDFKMQASLEHFDKQDIDLVRKINVQMAASVANSEAFTEAFFPSRQINANETGLKMEIRSMAFNTNKLRSTNGDRYMPDDKTIVDAIIDPEVLENPSLKIFPIATASSANKLVPEADFQNQEEVVEGNTFVWRPILNGTTVDLLGISEIPNVTATGQDSTDTLDVANKLKSVLLKVTNTTASKSENVLVDVSNSTESLYVRPQQGDTQRLVLSLPETEFSVTSKDVNRVDGNAFGADIATIGTDIDAASTNALTDFRLCFKIKAHGEMNRSNGDWSATASVDATVKGQLISDPTKQKDLADYTVQVLGVVPDSDRSNTNARTQGIVVTRGHGTSFLFPAHVQAPLSTKAPVVGKGYAATSEDLALAARAQRTHLAVSELIKIEEHLRANGNKSRFPGSRLCTPMLLDNEIKVSKFVNSNTIDAANAVSTAIIDAVGAVANELATQSKLYANLESRGLSVDDMEVIIGTSPGIAHFIKESGDIRSIGGTLKYRIVTTNSSLIKDHIKIAFRMKDTEKNADLCFGVRSSAMPMVFQAVMGRNNAQNREMIYHPRTTPYPVTPIMGNIKITGFNELFVVKGTKLQIYNQVVTP